MQLTLLRDHGVGRAPALADGVCPANPSINSDKSYALLCYLLRNKTLNNKANQLMTKKALVRECQLKYRVFTKYSCKSNTPSLGVSTISVYKSTEEVKRMTLQAVY